MVVRAKASRVMAQPTHSDGPTLNEALARTGMLEFAFCVLLSAGVLIG